MAKQTDMTVFFFRLFCKYKHTLALGLVMLKHGIMDETDYNTIQPWMNEWMYVCFSSAQS